MPYLINDFREATSEAKDEDLREPPLVGNMRGGLGATLEATQTERKEWGDAGGQQHLCCIFFPKPLQGVAALVGRKL